MISLMYVFICSILMKAKSKVLGKTVQKLFIFPKSVWNYFIEITVTEEIIPGK